MFSDSVMRRSLDFLVLSICVAQVFPRVYSQNNNMNAVNHIVIREMNLNQCIAKSASISKKCTV